MCFYLNIVFFFKQNAACEVRISDWSSDVCSSDLAGYDPSPTATAGVRAVMKGIRRSIGTAPVKKQAATADIVMRMLAQCGNDLIEIGRASCRARVWQYV